MRIFFSTVVLLAAFTAAFGQPTSVDAFAQNRRLGRGVNIIGYDPLWRSTNQSRFKEQHFRLLKEAGFNSIRINLHPFNRMSLSNEFKIPDNWMATVDWAVAKARANGLTVVLDLHEYNAMGNEPAGNREKFLSTWRQLSSHFAKEPSEVFFEILNEPNKQLTPALWNEYLAQALRIIRQTNPNRTVVVGPAFWNSIDHLKEFELPPNDRNLIVTVHYYKPMAFTHQGAAWNEQTRDKIGVEWLGTESDLAAINKDFDKVQAWSKEQNRPIYLGEFGAYDKGAMDSRARYTAAVARAAESRDWSWAYWQFDSDFILYDIPHDHWVDPILNALIPTK